MMKLPNDTFLRMYQYNQHHQLWNYFLIVL